MPATALLLLSMFQPFLLCGVCIALGLGSKSGVAAAQPAAVLARL